MEEERPGRSGYAAVEELDAKLGALGVRVALPPVSLEGEGLKAFAKRRRGAAYPVRSCDAAEGEVSVVCDLPRTIGAVPQSLMSLQGHPAPMVVAGLCVFCSRIAAQTCMSCGRLVCSDHLVPGRVPVCVACARGRGTPLRRGPL